MTTSTDSPHGRGGEGMTDIPRWYYVFFFILLAIGLTVTASRLVYRHRHRAAKAHHGKVPRHAEFKNFQKLFLVAYFVMQAADWLQGPYGYHVYAYYGFSHPTIGILVATGFASSLLFGTWVGPLADTYGRRRLCLIFSVTYSSFFMLMHVPNFWVLMLGRFLSGISTSILSCVFESWMVSEHLARGFDAAWLARTFSMMASGTAIVAIVVSLAAQGAVWYVGNPVVPFDIAAILLLCGAVIVAGWWKENFGQSSVNVGSQLQEAMRIVRRDPRVLLTGLQQGLFEGAMCTFVFMWTPTLEGAEPMPHGLIFACFMIAASVGGMLFKLIDHQVVSATKWIYFLAALSMTVPILTQSKKLILTAFVLFEMLVGLFWPSMSTLRANYLSEEYRATTANLFRIPLNAMVCAILLFQRYLDTKMVFTICTCMHLGAMAVSFLLQGYEGASSDRTVEDALASQPLLESPVKTMDKERETNGGQPFEI